ncbi:MAG: PAS domain-containing protein [Synechococcaceae cyanobacterium SM1_2_3]|nr:PAS domain-containing protein [Synechococcaceae cyanobacterium SM1_2_3]
MTHPADPDSSPPESAASPPLLNTFPIVGIGASAGGLEALEQFLKPVPKDCGMAFVIVQHLDPTHQGVMPELLQRSAKMPVLQVTDGMKVQPNCIYVIPPNKDMSLLHDVLYLFAPTTPRGLRLPIDFFFRSLAEDQRERSIGIILSGMGSDGALGLRAIKEKAGMTLVQEPTTAKFDGMPRSAINAELADIVAPAEELYKRLAAYLQHLPLIPRAEPMLKERDQSGLDKIVILLRAHTGHDFSQYKKSTLYRRIERRMGLHQFDKIAHYVRYLQENPQERELLFKELLIGVTNFFRDPPAWAQLQEQVIPALLANYPAGGQLRAWAAGCSTGEEAYSLAMAFKEALATLNSPPSFSLQIFATDLDRDAIAKARQGVYPENIGADVSPERLRRFFIKEESGGYRIGKEIREMVTLAPQNVIMDPPFTKLDLLICRNLLIYLTAELQKKLLALFHYSLNPGGVLFLGSAETIGNSPGLFTSIDGKWRFYRREGSKSHPAPTDFPNTFTSPLLSAPAEAQAIKSQPTLQMRIDQLLLQRYTPAAVLTNPQGDILYINGRTGKYLEPAAGQANWNLFSMAREGLHHSLPGLFQQALNPAADAIVTRRGLRVKTNGDFQTVDVTVQALTDPAELRGMLLVIFNDMATPPGKRGKTAKAPVANADLVQLEQEAQQLREALQATHEEMQTSQEELKSANEELQSTNEELQSTNEELTTSKEEMQSLNEELQTVNAELQSKVDDLSRANNDMKNLLNSTDIATLFLDDDLRVRRFTIEASKLIKLIPGDVGRPITDIASDLLYPALAADVADVLRTLVFVEKPLATQDGRWFTVRVMPYRTLDNRIDGVVLTFINITAAKMLELELRQAQEELNKLLANQSDTLAQSNAALKAERDG